MSAEIPPDDPVGDVAELSPQQAWTLLDAGRAVLVDVRTAEERRFVGRVPGSAHVPWAQGLDMAPNPDFVAAVESRFDKAETLLLLCRSGKRSAAATEAVLRAGFRRVFNVREGFEGEADAFGRRGLLDGWRFHGLPWIQD